MDDKQESNIHRSLIGTSIISCNYGMTTLIFIRDSTCPYSTTLEVVLVSSCCKDTVGSSY